MKRSSYFSVLMFLMTLQSSPLEAMNWEGHDDWLRDEDHARQLQMILPKARQHIIPNCDERGTMSGNNPYEQRPVPGKNCVESGASGSELDHN